MVRGSLDSEFLTSFDLNSITPPHTPQNTGVQTPVGHSDTAIPPKQAAHCHGIGRSFCWTGEVWGRPVGREARVEASSLDSRLSSSGALIPP